MNQLRTSGHESRDGHLPVSSRRPLSKNEAAIIAALADGKQSKEIADCVNLSKASIDTYIRILYGKLDARSRAQLVARAYALRILIPPE